MLTRVLLFLALYLKSISSQPNPAVAGANAPPPPPPGRGFQLECSDRYALLDVCDPNLLQQFQQNAPPGYQVTSVDPCIYPGKNAHRYLVKYTSANFRRCEDIRRVYHDMNTYKPQNSNVGSIAVIPGGYLVEYKQFCICYRRNFRRRRSWRGTALNFFSYPAVIDQAGNVVRCDNRDFTCGIQNF